TLGYELGMILTISTNGSRLWRNDVLDLLTTRPVYKLTISVYGVPAGPATRTSRSCRSTSSTTPRGPRSPPWPAPAAAGSPSPPQRGRRQPGLRVHGDRGGVGATARADPRRRRITHRTAGQG